MIKVVFYCSWVLPLWIYSRIQREKMFFLIINILVHWEFSTICFGHFYTLPNSFEIHPPLSCVLSLSAPTKTYLFCPVFLSVWHSIGAWSLTSSNMPKGNWFSFCLTSQKLARDHQLKQEVSWTPPFFMLGFSQLHLTQVLYIISQLLWVYVCSVLSCLEGSVTYLWFLCMFCILIYNNHWILKGGSVIWIFHERINILKSYCL